jgi:hypothetical protein
MKKWGRARKTISLTYFHVYLIDVSKKGNAA